MSDMDYLIADGIPFVVPFFGVAAAAAAAAFVCTRFVTAVLSVAVVTVAEIQGPASMLTLLALVCCCCGWCCSCPPIGGADMHTCCCWYGSVHHLYASPVACRTGSLRPSTFVLGLHHAGSQCPVARWCLLAVAVAVDVAPSLASDLGCFRIQGVRMGFTLKLWMAVQPCTSLTVPSFFSIN